MSIRWPSQSPEFDQFAGGYDSALAEGLRASGESKDYFARGRVEWLARLLADLHHIPAKILDFGCGTGSSTSWLLGLPGAETLMGVEVSPESIKVARRDHGSTRANFCLVSQCPAEPNFDLAFCNGVFHHIPPAERPAAARYVYESLRPGGLFAFWENNPWNPGTRYVMSRISFDRNALMLSHREGQRLLRAAGFQTVRTDFLFIFPRFLKFLRPLECMASKLPLGGQYLVLARRPKKQKRQVRIPPLLN